ncbi:hypothetical protein Tco_0716182 [Tanacetum coccineum]
MAGYTLKQLKRKSYNEIQEAFERTMKEIETFVPIDQEVESEKQDKAEDNNKRARAALEQESSKKQKVNEEEEIKELKQLMKVVQDEEIAIDAIPLAIKPPTIVDWKIVTEEFEREDLETLWTLMKNKYGSRRPEGGYERVLWGDLKTMFDPHVEDKV